jgi:DNA mismatch endonuclease (patch repair protein)
MGIGARVAGRHDSNNSWASSDATRHSMQRNRSRDTRPEVAVRSAVHAMGLRYRVAARPLREVRRTADLVFRGARVAVFVDGCFWHGCPDHFVAPRTNAAYWATKIGRNRDRDAETDALLAEAGWSVVRVWEHDDPVAGAARVSDAVAHRRSGRRPV